MVWRRLPTYFANIRLRLVPLSEKQQQVWEKTGHLSEVAFKTSPKVGKFEIKQYLERLYGLDVAKVRVLNYEGRKKAGKHGHYRRPDYKKAYVTLRPPQQPAATSTTS